MQMSEAFAGAVTVSIPIFALAAGTEARALRDRLKQKLNVDGPPAQAVAYFRDLPGLSKRFLAERVMAIGSGLKDAVGPQLAGTKGRGFVKQVFAELEGAFDRADKKEQEGDAGGSDGNSPQRREPADAEQDGQRS